MKKTISILIVALAMIFSFSAFADGGSWWGDGMKMPEMPEMPEIDTSTWGEFTAPEGWGEFSIDSFTSPLNGGSWGDMGFDSDFGTAFEEMKKKMESEMESKWGSSESDSWPPQSFKDLESAFNSQQSELETTQSSKDIQSIFKEMFGDVGSTDLGELPDLDASILNTNTDLDQDSSSLISGISSIANLNTISSFISGAKSNIDTDISFDSLTGMPSQAFTITQKDMKTIYEGLESGLSPQMDYKKTYNGSLFEKAGGK